MSVSRVARNIGSGYAGAAVNGVVMLLLTPLVVRHLSPRAYGIWVLSTAIGSYLGFLNAGSGAAGVRAVARLAGSGRIGDASRDIGSIFRIYLAVGVFASCALTILSFTTLDFFHVPAAEQAEARALLILIAINFLVSFPFGVTRSVLAGLHRFQELNAVEIVWALSRLGATFFLLSTGHGLLSLGSTQLATSIAGHLTRWLVIRRVAADLRRSLPDGLRDGGLGPALGIGAPARGRDPGQSRARPAAGHHSPGGWPDAAAPVGRRWVRAELSGPGGLRPGEPDDRSLPHLVDSAVRIGPHRRAPGRGNSPIRSQSGSG